MKSKLLTIVILVGAAAASPAAALISNDDTAPIYIVFAGPYSSSPSSAFGHLFIVIPGLEGESLPLWDVVSFTAETDNAGPLKYMTVGIAGGFWGHYEKLKFHEKTRDYQLLEDRDLWLVELRLSTEQRTSLDEAIEETSGEWSPYTFFSRNCAFYLQLLLSQATGVLPPPQGTVSPTEVFDLVLNSSLATETYFRPSASEYLVEMANHIESRVVDRLRESEWTSVAADTTWLASLDPKEQSFVQEFFAWRSLDHQDPLSEETRRGLGQLRVFNATNRNITTDRANTPGIPIPAPTFPGYTRIGFFGSHSALSQNRMGIRIRPAMRDGTDPIIGQRPINNLELLTAKISTPTDSLKLRVDELILYSQRSLNPTNWIKKKTSWMLEVQGRQGGIFSLEELHLELRSGTGRTFQVLPKLFTYGLITLGGVGPFGRTPTMALGAEGGVSWFPSSRVRAGLRWTREVDIFERSRIHQRMRGWFRYDLSRVFGLTLTAENYGNGNGFDLSLDWYR